MLVEVPIDYDQQCNDILDGNLLSNLMSKLFRLLENYPAFLHEHYSKAKIAIMIITLLQTLDKKTDH